MDSRNIREKADSFRARYAPDNTIPVDADLIAERAGIDIVPTANLRNDVGIEACISADLKSLYLDLEYSMNPRMDFRVRFSIAHELGHVKLHKHIFDRHAREGRKTVSEWAKHVQNRIDTPILEREANEFAGCLLVPEPALRSQYEDHYPLVCEVFRKKGLDLDALKPESLRASMASPIHRKFEVSAKVIEIRLQNCGIIPDNR